MDSFVDPLVPSQKATDLSPGVIYAGAADFTLPDARGFLGAADPTFAGVPMTAASPLECNRKVTDTAIKYNEFAKLKYAVFRYDQAYSEYQNRVTTECICTRSETGPRVRCPSKEELLQDPRVCIEYGNRWSTGNMPLPPLKPTPTKTYTEQEIAYFTMIENQTVECVGGTCAPSSAVYADNTIGPAIANLAWTFFASAKDAPFGMQCQAHFRAAQQIAANTGAVAVTGTGDADDLGRRALATVPYTRSDCAVSRIDATKPPVCTSLAATRTVDGDQSLAWFYSLPLDKATVSQAGEMQRICRDYDSYNSTAQKHKLPECSCINAEDNPSFVKLNTNFTTTTKLCWYRPCYVTGSDRLITPADEIARRRCQANVCQSVLNIVDATDIKLDDLKQMVNCSEQKSWDDAAAKKGAASGDGAGGGLGGVIAGASGQISAIASAIDWGAIAPLIVAGVIALLLLIAAALLWFSKPQPRPPSANDAGAAVTVEIKNN
jgi:hypothetical protein